MAKIQTKKSHTGTLIECKGMAWEWRPAESEDWARSGIRTLLNYSFSSSSKATPGCAELAASAGWGTGKLETWGTFLLFGKKCIDMCTSIPDHI